MSPACGYGKAKHRYQTLAENQAYSLLFAGDFGQFI